MSDTEHQQMTEEAKGLAEQLVAFAKDHGWVNTKPVKANKKFAFVTLTRDYDDYDGPVREELRAFYAIDDQADDDQVTHIDAEGTTTVLDPDSGGVREVIEAKVHHDPAPTDEGDDMVEKSAQEDVDESPSAAHSAAHQPPVPPTDTASAAHSDVVPPTEGADAAHSEDGAAHQRTVVEDFGIVPPADERDVADEAKAHLTAAGEAAVQGEHPVASQQDTYAAVRHQQVNPHRNWSAEASALTSKELLTKLGVNRKTNNRMEITWVNSLSNSLDRAVVSGDAQKYPPHITPADFDPEAHGEDLRILHFLEFGGGFRSVAVARIKKIG